MDLLDKKQWEENYINNQGIDCPWCGQDRPDHSCENCRSEMSQEDCWKYKGYCSEKCLKYITEYLPEHRKQKEEMGIRCKCDDPQCAKCLLVNCIDENCPTHPKTAKEDFRKKYNNR